MPTKKPIPAVAASMLLLALVSAAGCASTPGKVSKSELATIRQDAMHIPPGTPRDAALAKLKATNTVRLGAGTYSGVAVEEWKSEAFTETNDGRDLYVAFLYFADGKLADVSDQRIDFRNKPAIIQEWAGKSVTTGTAK